MSKVAAD